MSDIHDRILFLAQSGKINVNRLFTSEGWRSKNNIFAQIASFLKIPKCAKNIYMEFSRNRKELKDKLFQLVDK
jgi:hypothetical protein